jgi:uncharacterized protein DUF3268
MQRHKGPKRKPKPDDDPRPAQRRTKSRIAVKRARQARRCPVHGHPLVWSGRLRSWWCPEADCAIRQGVKQTSTPCDAETGNARRELHLAFDPLWRGRGKRFSNRQRAYIWLAGALGISQRECHVGKFTAAMCEAAEQKIRELLKQ